MGTSGLRHALLCLLLCSLYVTTVYCDAHGYTEKLRNALEAASNQTEYDGPISVQAIDPVGGEFSCDTETILATVGSTATHVHALSPAHIQVVGAMGDSITAAMGARASNIFENLNEYRGVSWSIGGDLDVTRCATLPNIIKMYNPNVKGYSIDKGGENSANARLNVAVSGAIAQDLPGQARKLVDKIKGDQDININEDWKVITIWIGGNDLCDVCKGNSRHHPDSYKGYIQDALDILHDELPRTFVNMVLIMDITRLAPLNDLWCSIIHLAVCSCATGSNSDKEQTSKAAEEYQAKVRELVDSRRYDTRDDFTVVVQPFFVEVDIPYEGGKPDKSYFAPDCFHFSVKGHKVAAVALWNNMIEPVGQKTEDWEVEGAINCLSPDFPYFYTHKNSMPNSQSFGAFSNDNTGSQGGDDEPGSSSASGSSLLGVILGTSIAVCVVVVAVVVVGVGVVLVRRRRRRGRGSGGERAALIGDSKHKATQL